MSLQFFGIRLATTQTFTGILHQQLAYEVRHFFAQRYKETKQKEHSLLLNPVPFTNVYFLQSGIGGEVFKILLEISCWVFLSPSTVNGDAPVNNSYVKTPTDHQSTACNRKQALICSRFMDSSEIFVQKTVSMWETFLELSQRCLSSQIPTKTKPIDLSTHIKSIQFEGIRRYTCTYMKSDKALSDQ